MLVPPEPKPLLTADAEINVSLINDAVATDIELVWSTLTKDAVSSFTKKELVWSFVINDDVLSEVKNELVCSLVLNEPVSIELPPPNPLLAADAEMKVSDMNDALSACIA